jgi:S1-C subfamily serine protease
VYTIFSIKSKDILTNAHLVQPHVDENQKLRKGTFITVKLECEDLKNVYDGELIFISKGVLDLAIIKVTNFNRIVPSVSLNDKIMKQGEKVFVIGYPLFNPNSNISSTITGYLPC